MHRLTHWIKGHQVTAFFIITFAISWGLGFTLDAVMNKGIFLYQFFFFNATGEEAGWRGFALPRMQSLTSPLVACLVVNISWALWHLFFWMAEGRPVSSPEYWAQTYL
jgi:membrane protease YdiL (CAAX protease family)